MGSYVGKLVDEQTKKSQDFMLSAQDNALGRQIQMQNYMREQQMAMQVARGRDMFQWWAAFYATTGLVGTVGFLKTKKPGPLIPLLPLGFVGAYYYDLAYGTKLQRMRDEARKVLAEETQLIDLPTGLPTLAKLDARRKETQEKTQK